MQLTVYIRIIEVTERDNGKVIGYAVCLQWKLLLNLYYQDHVLTKHVVQFEASREKHIYYAVPILKYDKSFTHARIMLKHVLTIKM